MLCLTSVILVAIFSACSISLTPVFGDGLFEEKLSAALGDRKANLIIKMTPPVVTIQTLTNKSQNPLIEFALSDSNTNKSFSHVTYFITIEKEGKKLLSDWFHDHAGNLRIQMKPSNLSQVVVYGEQDPILNAYSGTSDSPVVAAGPIFLEGGLYHFIVRIATVDFDRTMLPDDKQPVFDGYLSVGNIENYSAVIDGKESPIRFTSYYDKIRNITFNEAERQLTFNMPFDWNLSRMQDVNIFVHEEIAIPKFSNITSRGYSGLVNGFDVSKQLVLDNSNPTEDVVHFMLPKDKLISLAQQVRKNIGSDKGLMEFTLRSTIGTSVMKTNMTSMGA
ncbi:MAG TPA: hypothetical protein VH415_10905 [Nitrososphaeraceae archaeon]|jgi:hypothetical protein